MRLVDIDRIKDILEYGILCNVPADAVNTEEEKLNDWVQEVVDKAPTIEAIPKADYEARLKADMVAMLTEIDNEIMRQYIEHTEADWHDIIQQKINALKKIGDIHEHD